MISVGQTAVICSIFGSFQYCRNVNWRKHEMAQMAPLDGLCSWLRNMANKPSSLGYLSIFPPIPPAKLAVLPEVYVKKTLLVAFQVLFFFRS